MPTQAIRAMGIALRLGNGVPLAGIGVTGATNAAPIVLTTASAHGVTDVSVVTVTGVLGNTAANGTWIAAAVDTTHLTLRGTAGNGAYTSGGTVTVTETFTTIAEMTNIEDAGLSAQVLDVTAHDGLAGYASRIPTFLQGNAMRLSLNYVPAHPTHDPITGLEFLLQTRTRRNFLLVMPDNNKTTWRWTGWVVQDRKQAPVAGALTSQVTIEIDGAPLLA